MKKFTDNIKNGIQRIALILILALPGTSLLAQATATTAMEEKFGVSDSTVLFILIGIAVMFTIIIITVLDAIKNLARSRELWKGKFLDKLPLVLLGLISLPLTVSAGPYKEIETSALILDESTFWLLVIADFTLFAIAVYYIYMLKKLTAAIRGEVAVEPSYEEAGPSWAENLLKGLTDAVPIKDEKDVLTDHDYDGIQELDNNLPPWWKWMFYITIGWAFVYVIYYHVLELAPLQEEEYTIQVAEAEAEVQAYLEARALNVDENSIELVLEESRIKPGKGIFTSLCKQCHGGGGEGGVGPNLTDDYWIHGGSIKDVFKTIKYGVPTKGMISWQDQLSPIQMQNVATYIMTLRGTNPPNPKAPQGELYKPQTTEPVAPALEGELEDPVDTEALPEGDGETQAEKPDQTNEPLVSEVTN